MRVGGGHHPPCGLCPGLQLALQQLAEQRPGGGAGAGRSPPAAGTGSAAAQQRALAALGTQERVMLVLQLQQLGPHLLIPAQVCREVGGELQREPSH